MKKLFFVIGTRPNIIKLSPLPDILKNYPEINYKIIHTGQHYDYNMSQIFFDELEIPQPDYYLDISGSTQTQITASIMVRFESLCIEEKPDGVVIFGDVNSSLAAALVTSKLHIPCFHIEAGLRSFNNSMPEEINRIICDHICDVLYVPTLESMYNIKVEGLASKALYTGDIMLDAFNRNSILAKNKSQILTQLNLLPNTYYIATLHRPYNVDDKTTLTEIISTFQNIPEKIIFAIHPRTYKNIKKFGINVSENVIITEPLGYFDFLQLLNNTIKVITDSGGVQKEAYFAGKPCITLRPETEWIETIKCGANILVPVRTKSCIIDAININNSPDYSHKLYGSGNTCEIILNDIQNILNNGK